MPDSHDFGYVLFNMTHYLGSHTFKFNYPCFMVNFILLSDTIKKCIWLVCLVLEWHKNLVWSITKWAVSQ